MKDGPEKGNPERRYAEEFSQARHAVVIAKNDLKRANRFYRVSLANQRNIWKAHTDWKFALNEMLQAEINEAKAYDALQAVKAGRSPVVDRVHDVRDPAALPKNAEEARCMAKEASTAYNAVRHRHDDEHARRRAAWEHANAMWAIHMVSDRENALRQQPSYPDP